MDTLGPGNQKLVPEEVSFKTMGCWLIFYHQFIPFCLLSLKEVNVPKTLFVL
jgi:hypothetical protein